jgi:hypothetical protein
MAVKGLMMHQKLTGTGMVVSRAVRSNRFFILIHSKTHWFSRTPSSFFSVKSFLILDVLGISSYIETEKPGP